MGRNNVLGFGRLGLVSFGFSSLGLGISLFKGLGYNRFWVLGLFRGLVQLVLDLQFGSLRFGFDWVRLRSRVSTRALSGQITLGFGFGLKA